MLYLCKKAFFGKIPFPAIHLDSGHDFSETYQFREKLVKEWNINLIIGRVKHEKDEISGTALVIKISNGISKHNPPKFFITFQILKKPPMFECTLCSIGPS